MSKKPSCRFRKYINYSKLEQIESKQAETALKFSVCKLANKMLEAENADLRTQLEKAERERDEIINAFREKVEDFKDEIKRHHETGNLVSRLQDENAALKQKLEAVREWVKLYDPDWDNDINTLKKILDWE